MSPFGDEDGSHERRCSDGSHKQTTFRNVRQSFGTPNLPPFALVTLRTNVGDFEGKQRPKGDVSSLGEV
jgi:hypothetical protein